MYAKVNQLIRSVNDQNETIADYIQQFVELRNFVDDYFDNLDVQEEINNKLDAMTEDGTLGAILVEYLKPTIDAQNNRINGLESNYDTLSARMDTFTNLPEGSTSGDAELADIRTGFNGFTFTSAGSAVRGEDSYIDNKVNIVEEMLGLIPTNWEVGAIDPNTGEDFSSNTFIRTIGYISRNSQVFVKVETGYRGVIIWYNNDNTLAGTQNFTGSFLASHETATKFRIVLRSTTDRVAATVDFAKYINIYDMRPYIIQDICEGDIFVDFDNTNKYIAIKTYDQAFVFLRGIYQSIYNLDTTVAYPETTGHTYSLIYDFTTKTFSIIPFYTTPNTHQKLITKFVLSSDRVVQQRLIYPNGNVNISVNGKSLKHIFNNISILGDSYSTYKDWILPTDRDYYPTASAETNNVQSVTQTYWYQLAHSLNSNILVNDSFGGSTVALTVRTGHTYEDSFIRRMENSFGKGRAGEQKPDLILICGGTNDFWNNVTVGSVKYSGWTESDLQKFAPAFCYMLSYIKEFNPNAKIVNITNDILGADYKSAMSTACSHYSVLNVSLSDITKMSNHPDIEGMESIHDQLLYDILRTI
jgi:lysophospholipase L1-like esterase